jgi:hypothetical protein
MDRLFERQGIGVWDSWVSGLSFFALKEFELL